MVVVHLEVGTEWLSAVDYGRHVSLSGFTFITIRLDPSKPSVKDLSSLLKEYSLKRL